MPRITPHADAAALRKAFEAHRKQGTLTADAIDEVIDTSFEDKTISNAERSVILAQLARGGFDADGERKLRDYLQGGVLVDAAQPKLGWGTDAVAYRPLRGALFSRPPSPRDIRQGDLGDCYFEAVMGSLALQRPDYLQNAIKENADGSFTVRFFAKTPSGTKPQYVTVDAMLPVDAQGQPTYSAPVDGQLWPAVLEKAYAKFKGGYGFIGQGGLSSDSMFDLTGRHSVAIENANAPDAHTDEVFARMQHALERHELVTAGTIIEREKLPPRYDEGHAYTVMAVGGTGSKRWIDVRNPYGLGNEESGATYPRRAVDAVIRVPLREFFKRFDEVCLGSVPALR